MLNFLYAAFLTVKRGKVSVYYSIAALLCHIAFLYVYLFYIDELVPFTIPRWMTSGDIHMYAGTFLMPTLAYALSVLIVRFTPEAGQHKAWVNFLLAIGVPVMGYVFVQLILPLWRRSDSLFLTHVLLVLLITATLLFLFFLVRAVYILASKRTIAWQQHQLFWKLPIALLLPLTGLGVNNGNILRAFYFNESGIFGDFNHPWFYVLAVLNGTLICLPNRQHPVYRFFLFIARSITFTYTTYFFLVFLPFLPLSIVAILVLGLGFLLLVPLLLFIIHVKELLNDFSYLLAFFPKKLLTGLLITGLLVIPVCITVSYLRDKNTLDETLDYLYRPDYSKSYHIDTASLHQTLRVIRRHKDRSNDAVFGNRIPYLSSYFNWLVLDNLTLSDAKIYSIEKIFYGTTSFQIWPDRSTTDSDVHLSHLSANSIYDKTQNAWKSWIDLEATNNSTSTSEYLTTIDLPEGCWISDFYLYIGKRKEKGILAEKKSAMWVFSNIRNERKDPGILYYLTGNKVALRIFPFAQGEVRKTGIELLHKEPVKITIGDQAVELGNGSGTKQEKTETKNLAYVSAQQKQTLQRVRRAPYFHFLVDVSKNKQGSAADFINRIKKINAQNKLLASNAKISFVNSYVNTLSFNKNWEQQYQSQHFEGGFYLQRAIETTLFNAYKSTERPVIVVVTDSIQNAVVNKDFADFGFTFPESPLFFDLSKTGNLQPHSLVNDPLKKLPDTTIIAFDQPVLEYKLSEKERVYLPDNKAPSIVLKKDILTIDEAAIKAKHWPSALAMQGQWMSQVLHPETATDKDWERLVRNSFRSQVMNPATSYLVVENEAQKAILKKKQEQVLSGNKLLDLDNETQRMSEPALWLPALLCGIFLWTRKRKRQQILKTSAPSGPGL